MHIFVTGASGFIGRALTKELIDHGHTVLGLARSDANVETLTGLGATAHKGSLTDIESLKSGARQADAVIHLAFIHDFSKLGESNTADQDAIKAWGEVLAGTGKPLIIASATLFLTKKGGVVTEDTEAIHDGSLLSQRALAADLVYELSKTNQIRGMVVRIPPSVHGQGDQGLIPTLVGLAKKNGKAVYVDDGSQRWPAVSLQDAAVLFRLAVEKGRAGATYHVIAEEGVRMKDINHLVGEKLGLPVERQTKEQAEKLLGFFANMISIDGPTSSVKTQKELGWNPTGPGLLQDMADYYFSDSATSKYSLSEVK